MAVQLITLLGFENTFPRARAIKTSTQSELNELDYDRVIEVRGSLHGEISARADISSRL